MPHLELSLPPHTPPDQPFLVTLFVAEADEIDGLSLYAHHIQLSEDPLSEHLCYLFSLQMDADEGELCLEVELKDGTLLETDIYAVRSEQGIYLSDQSLDEARRQQDQYELSELDYLLRHSANGQDEPGTVYEHVKDTLIKVWSSALNWFGLGPTPTCITLSGRLTWLDIKGGEHPLADTLVELHPRSEGDTVITYTDAEGRYSLTSQPTTRTQTYYLFVYAQTHHCRVSASLRSSTAYSYLMRYDDLEPGQTLTQQDRVIDPNAGSQRKSELNSLRAFPIAQAIHIGHTYVHLLDEEEPEHDVTILCYPNGSSTKTSFCSTDGGYLSIYETAYCAWDILLHEFGHWLQYRYGFLDTPGGSHASGSDDIERRGNKDEGIRLAWCESWPTVFAILSTRYLNLEGFPYVNDLEYNANNSSYDDEFWQYSLADADLKRLGEGCERSIMQVLYELQLGDLQLWQLITRSRATTFSQFVNYALQHGVTAEQLGPVLSAHGMAAHHLELSPDQQSLTFIPGGNPASPLSLQDQATLRISHSDGTLLAELPAQIIDNTRGTVDLSTLSLAPGMSLQLFCSQSSQPVTGPYPSQIISLNPPSSIS